MLKEKLKGRKAVLFEKLENSKVKCLACKHYCIIPEGKTGICNVRANYNGELYLLVKNRPYALAIDPIEKKPFYHLLPSTYSFSLGTVGCNFHCLWCQNWEMSQIIKEYANFDLKKALEFIDKNSVYLEPEKIVDLVKEKSKDLNIKSVSYTYNEPTIFTEYAKEIANLAKKEGFLNLFVSSAYESNEALNYLKEIDAFNFDLKLVGKDYVKYTGAIYEKVLETIEKAWKKGKWIEITTLIIPGINDNEKVIKEIVEFISSLSENIPYHLTRFYPHYKMLNKPITPIETLKKAYEIAKKELNYAYLGNIPYKGFEKYYNTYCPNCNTLLIERNYYEGKIKVYLEKGRCPSCGRKIKGIWD